MNNLRTTVLLAALVMSMPAFIGCQEAEKPNVRQTRLIADQNRQLNEQVDRLNLELQDAKAQCQELLDQKQEKLDACMLKKAELEEQLAGKFDQNLKELIDTIIAESQRLSEENLQLKAELEQLKSQQEPNSP